MLTPSVDVVLLLKLDVYGLSGFNQGVKMVRSVTGIGIRDLFIADIIAEGEAREHLKAAELAIREGLFARPHGQKTRSG